MAALSYRKAILNKLITDFTALVHSDGTSKLFAGVKKHYVDLPDARPVCEILPTDNSPESQGLSEDDRPYAFTAVVYDTIEGSNTDEQAEVKIDRLADIEDCVLNYLQKIPNPIERSIVGVHIYKVKVRNVQYNYQQMETGLAIAMHITFNTHVNIIPQRL